MLALLSVASYMLNPRFYLPEILCTWVNGEKRWHENEINCLSPEFTMWQQAHTLPYCRNKINQTNDALFQCLPACGTAGHKTRLLTCEWESTGQPAEAACDLENRPAVSKPCKTRPCPLGLFSLCSLNVWIVCVLFRAIVKVKNTILNMCLKRWLSEKKHLCYSSL